ncbi:uncharacterized protein LOC134713856 isoform X2 [Mytilus trossulus]|uniref:uncharacterized protein LOC134713856 isoform X2 n=1 Tax=Mytilus trossulus TaxID=6551 RepID=UPI003006CED5
MHKKVNKANNRTISENHTQSCSDNETQTLDCLNGGSCFVVFIEERIVKCACYTQYVGTRCEMINTNRTLKQFEGTEEKDVDNRHIPGITAGVVTVFIVLLAIILIRRIERNSSEGNGSETTKIV